MPLEKFLRLRLLRKAHRFRFDTTFRMDHKFLYAALDCITATPESEFYGMARPLSAGPVDYRF
jgi:hypothetical protein